MNNKIKRTTKFKLINRQADIKIVITTYFSMFLNQLNLNQSMYLKLGDVKIVYGEEIKHGHGGRFNQ